MKNKTELRVVRVLEIVKGGKGGNVYKKCMQQSGNPYNKKSPF